MNFPFELLGRIAEYLEMKDCLNLFKTCRLFKSLLPKTYEIIKATRQNYIYQNQELLALAYKNHPNFILKLAIVPFNFLYYADNQDSFYLGTLPKNKIIQFVKLNEADSIFYKDIDRSDWYEIMKLNRRLRSIDYSLRLIQLTASLGTIGQFNPIELEALEMIIA
jgi:hypothetical protein